MAPVNPAGSRTARSSRPWRLAAQALDRLPLVGSQGRLPRLHQRSHVSDARGGGWLLSHVGPITRLIAVAKRQNLKKLDGKH